MIQRRVSLGIVGARNGTPDQYRIAEGPRTHDDIVLYTIVHLVAIFDIDAGAAGAPNYIVLHQTIVGTMDDDAAMMSVLDRVIRELTRGAVGKAVEVEAVLPSDTPLSAFLDAGVAYGHCAVVHLGGVQSHRALCFMLGAAACVGRIVVAGYVPEI